MKLNEKKHKSVNTLGHVKPVMAGCLPTDYMTVKPVVGLRKKRVVVKGIQRPAMGWYSDEVYSHLLCGLGMRHHVDCGALRFFHI